ncbi:hypothetical protein FOMPIDRAFT_1047569 [Fomitopsis schrenkii]|uniref:Uncharacterized protein n=1 Tax=Fomitopsis schrenkii TaxID=2126942 RepID=S8EE64_FOMSC|nr:hypothetical protein FOMPIDRAFT_1047569 [Fomitopsis schrenkii]
MGKKGPPYDDDPEGKYIVIEAPFPGHKTGKARDKAYWDWLGGWVYYMTGKKEDPIAIYYVHTRDEVIVQLSEDFDITPILGAHVWQEVLTFGDPKYLKRTSFVFEYNYRIRGHPGSHGWEEEWPTGGDPNDPRKFPVKFPYPRPHWATTRGKNCADLALSLPQSRVRTPPPPALPPPPEPEASLFEPYEEPAHLGQARHANIDEELRQAQEREAEAAKMPISDLLLVDKRDPYEEEDAALQFVKQEPVELHIKEEVDIKQETFEPRIKKEHDHLGSEPQPSKEFMAAFNRLEHARYGQEPVAMREPTPQTQPSQEFMAAFMRLEQVREAHGQSTEAPATSDRFSAEEVATTSERGRSATSPPGRARSETWTPGVQVKPEPQEDILPPPPAVAAQPTRDPRLARRDARVKPEREEPRLPPPPSRPENEAIRVKPEPEDHRMPPPAYVRPPEKTQDPRQRGKLPPFKRVKREEDGGPPKRPRTDQRYP